MFVSRANVLIFISSSFKLAFWQCDILSARWYLTLISIEVVRLSNHLGIFRNLECKTLGKRKKKTVKSFPLTTMTRMCRLKSSVSNVALRHSLWKLNHIILLSTLTEHSSSKQSKLYFDKIT